MLSASFGGTFTVGMLPFGTQLPCSKKPKPLGVRYSSGHALSNFPLTAASNTSHVNDRLGRAAQWVFV